MTATLARVGGYALRQLGQVGALWLLLVEVVKTAVTRPARWRETVEQMFWIGWQSQTVVVITGMFTGMVFAMQTGQQFQKVRMETAVGPVVSLAMLRELAPVLTALMVAGRVGAAIAAQLGTMKVTEQIDALRAMGTAPVDYLAVPRFLALVVALPLLTAEAMAIGIYAGYFVAVHMLGIDGAYLLENMFRFTQGRDVTHGLTKSVFFAVLIAVIACHKGFSTEGGAEGVGQATTQAVVAGSLAVLIANFFIAVMFNALVPV